MIIMLFVSYYTPWCILTFFNYLYYRVSKVKKNYKPYEEARLKIEELFSNYTQMQELTSGMEGMKIKTREETQEEAAEGLIMTAEQWELWVVQWEKLNNK